jgi:hypothetical protein
MTLHSNSIMLAVCYSVNVFITGPTLYTNRHTVTDAEN